MDRSSILRASTMISKPVLPNGLFCDAARELGGHIGACRFARRALHVSAYIWPSAAPICSAELALARSPWATCTTKYEPAFLYIQVSCGESFLRLKLNLPLYKALVVALFVGTLVSFFLLCFSTRATPAFHNGTR